MINIIQKQEMNFGDLFIGDLFMYDFSVYIKIINTKDSLDVELTLHSEDDSGRMVNAYNLTSNFISFILEHTKVQAVKGDLVLK